MTDIAITLHNPTTGQSESLPISNSMTVAEVLELAKALLGMDAATALTKDGKVLTPQSSSLAQVGVTNGDLLAAISTPPTRQHANQQQQRQQMQRPGAAASGGGGGLDFSSLLAGAGTSAPPSSAAARYAGSTSKTPVYYQGMTLADATEYNPHPEAIVLLLQTKDHLFKELRFRNPMLATKLDGQPFDRAVVIWRDEMVKGSIGAAAAISQSILKENTMKERIERDPNDAEAKAYFERKKNKQLVDEQYHQTIQEYPESLGRVLMLYINCSINNHPLQAFVDSGAQMTIMSKRTAQRVGILHLVDTRFAGVAIGVGTGKILGKVHIAQLQIGGAYFPCSITVMDDSTLPVGGPQTKGDDDEDKPKPKDMDFLLGLDMLKRFKCNIDLGEGKLKFRIGPDEFLETDFLHEYDLDISKGGTKGFDANKANEELMAAHKKWEEEQDAKRQKGESDDTDGMHD